MKVLRLFIILVLASSSIYSANAEYQITGSVNLSSDWQRQIFLSTINKIDDYYKSDPSDIIQVGSINEDGSFILSGDNLPPDDRFYRLFLIKEENSEFDACMYNSGDDHNFIHLILNNNTLIHLQSDNNQNSPFANCKITGSQINNNLRSLSELILPSFYFHQIKFQSELQFSEQKLNRDLFHFADTCQTPLVSLVALINTDMDQYFEEESERYEAFADRLSNSLPNHDYTDNYFRKLKYHQGSNEINSNLPWWVTSLIGILSFALIISFMRIRSLSQKLENKKQDLASISKKQLPILTQQEEKILKLIGDGKSNKEIATELFIELSTVKTHINKLYTKLKIKNRNEARQKVKLLTSIEV
jgi:DNA-binding CsgD family transcriptional regulator